MNQAAIAIVFTENRKKILLVKRRDVPVWVLPGGGIEPGEEPTAACVREALEETGYTIAITRKVGTYHPCNRLTQVTHIYEASILSGTATLSAESQAVSFFPLDALPKKLPPPHGNWIREAHADLPYTIERKITEVTYTRVITTWIRHPILMTQFFITKWKRSLDTKESS
ncbi:MAG: NUDIX hydrolase [Chlamydiota bacterium]